MTGDQAREQSLDLLDVIADLKVKVLRSDNALAKSDLEILDDGARAVQVALNGLPFGPVQLPAKAPNNITWNFNNAMVRGRAAIKTITAYGFQAKASLIGEIVKRTEEVVKSPLTLGGTLPTWAPWAAGGVLVLVIVILVLK